jgi:hypothetical protein
MSIQSENDRSRRDLEALAIRLTDEQLAAELGDGWTTAAIYAHIGFWERVALLIFQRHPRNTPGYPTLHEDVTNDALLPEWRALPPRVAINLCIEAMAALDTEIHAHDGDVLSHFEDADDFPGMDRSGHRDWHRLELEKHFFG